MTDPAMVRYFMTKREATDLLWTAARIEPPQDGGGQTAVLVLNMGQPVRIDELARRMIILAGLEPERDIQIVYSGMRPGERLTEFLFEDSEPKFDIGIRGSSRLTVFSRPRQNAGWPRGSRRGLCGRR